MSLSYTPEESGWKVGDVVSYSPDSTTVSIKMSMQVAANSVVPIGGGDPRVHGKFEFGIAEEMYGNLHILFGTSTHRVPYTTWIPCLLDADWCLRSDAVADSRLQGRACWGQDLL